MEMLKYQNTNSQVLVDTYSSHSPLWKAPAEASKVEAGSLAYLRLFHCQY